MQIKSYYDLDYVEREQVLLQISKPMDFFKTWFDNLPNTSGKTECFNHLNELHFEVFKTYMYNDYNAFQKAYSRYIYNKRP